MNLTEKYVSELGYDTVHDIIMSYETFMSEGKIGDSAIRNHTNNFLELYKIPNENITLWMTYIAFECYRRFAHSYIKHRMSDDIS